MCGLYVYICVSAQCQSLCRCECTCECVCVIVLPFASLPLSLSPGEEPVLKAVLQLRPLETRLAALYPDRGKPTVHHVLAANTSWTIRQQPQVVWQRVSFSNLL